VLAASFAVQSIALATPLCSQIVIDKVIPHQVEGTLAVIAAALALLIVFSSVLGWIRQHLVIHVGNRIDAALGGAVFRHLVTLPLPYFERRPTGVLAARLAGIETIREFLSGAAVTLLLDLPFVGLFLALMLVYSPSLTAVTLAFVLALAVLSAVVAPLFRARLDAQFLCGARNQALLTEHLAGIETVKSLQMEASLARRYDDGLAAYLTASFATRRLGNAYSTLAGALEQLQGAAVLCAGALLVMRGGDFTIGMLVAFQMFSGRVTQPLLRMAGLWQQFQMARVAVRRLADVMDVPPEPHRLVAAAEGSGPARIGFHGVGFRYDATRPRVLDGFDLDIAPGECVAIVGASGAGKSTLAKLLQGFVHPTEGEVRVDGRDTRRYAVNELRSALGVVPQETVLFSGNVHDNVVVGHPHASHEAVVEACRLAGIHAAVQALPEGYQTQLGERGSGLSGGQRQRIAIARALLRRPRALVFDEATSNLDPAVAGEVAATIARLRGRVTILFITHRIPAALGPDRVVEIGAAPTLGAAPPSRGGGPAAV
jgi:subfamily B ATP-binding cassette protein HlyB/CyaB